MCGGPVGAWSLWDLWKVIQKVTRWASRGAATCNGGIERKSQQARVPFDSPMLQVTHSRSGSFSSTSVYSRAGAAESRARLLTTQDFPLEKLLTPEQREISTTGPFSAVEPFPGWCASLGITLSICLYLPAGRVGEGRLPQGSWRPSDCLQACVWTRQRVHCLRCPSWAEVCLHLLK